MGSLPLRRRTVGFAFVLLAGSLLLIPNPRAEAAPPRCDDKPATIVGTSGDDVLKGTNFADVIVGLGGNDRIQAAGGDDTICGNDGEDTLIGGPGDDVILGGNGSDWIGYGNAQAGVTVALADGTASGDGSDRLVSIENIVGSAQRDVLKGTPGPNTLRGNGGDDSLFGQGGADDLLGGPGNDLILGGSGDDMLRGGAGDDGLLGGPGDDELRGAAGDDALEGDSWTPRTLGTPGDDVILGGNGRDLLAFGNGDSGVVVRLPVGTSTGQGNDTLAGIDDVEGTAYADVIIGNAGSNRIEGRANDDWINAGAGTDEVFGGVGRDFLDGGPGTDVLNGGYGLDECTRGETIAGCWPALVKLEPDAGNEFGPIMAIGDELFAVKGELGAGGTPAVFVYERYGISWRWVTTLTPPAIYPAAGFSGEVAVAGNQVFIGDPEMDSAGAVWIYTRAGDNWSRRRAVLAAPPNGERLGSQVASDGHRIATAARWGEYAAVLTPDGPGWQSDMFHIGGPVVLGGVRDVAVDGDVVVVGFAEGESAHIFTWTGADWVRDIVNAAGTHAFGAAVEVEGTRVVVGASGATPGPGGPGSVHVFERVGDVWQGRTIAVEGEGFGQNVALSGDTILAGTSHSAGTIKSFTYRHGEWQARVLDFPASLDTTWAPMVFRGDSAAMWARHNTLGTDDFYFFEPPPAR